MDAARKSNLANKNRQRWADCTEIAVRLDGWVGVGHVSKHLVHNYLYIELVKANKLELAKIGDPATFEWLKTTQGWLKMQDHLNGPPLKISTGRKKDDDTADTPEAQIRVAMWYIRKVGCIEQAKIAFSIACDALTKLEKKSVENFE